MEYNTAKPKMIIPEYGRNIQTLIEYAKEIEDPAYRQAFVEEIVLLMQNMHPQARNVEDYKAKLWSHVYRIANYELDVVFPEHVNLEPIEKKRPKPVPYPDGSVKFRHYGRNVQEMIKKAAAMEEGDKKNEFTRVIGTYMKTAYKSWNQPVVNDVTIIRDFKELAGDTLNIDDNLDLDENSSREYRDRRSSDDRRRSSDKRGSDNYRKNDRRSSKSSGTRRRK